MAIKKQKIRNGKDNRQNAILEILEAIDRCKDNADAVFDVILKYSAQLCNAPFANLNIVDASGKHLDFVREYGESHLHFKPGWRWDIDTPLAIARAVREKSIIHIADITDTDEYRAGETTRKQIADEEGIRTFLAVPLISNGKAIGSIGLFRREVAPFSDVDIDLLETFAQQAVLAIKHVRRYHELNKKLAREAATTRILQVISASRTDPAPVFDVILRNSAKLSGAPLANLCLLNDARSHWHLVAHFGDGLRHLAVGRTAMPMESELVPAVTIRTAGVVHIEDLTNTDLYRQGDPGRVAMVEEEGMRTILCVPLMSDDTAIGCITLFQREIKAFSVEEIALVETFAAQAVIAIENVNQYRALADRTAEVEALNASLETRVEEQVAEIERMGKLKRFLPSAVADAVVLSGNDKLLSSHRALVAVLFADIRGFTSFCETAEPEETIEVLQTYHQEMGQLISQYGAGIDLRMGDGIMVLFNDPLPCDDPAGDALKLAIAMRDRMSELCRTWKRVGHRLGFGVGASLGYATVGLVGFEGRSDYTASGTAINIGARLCEMAKDGEILLSTRAAIAVENSFPSVSTGESMLKGIREPVEVFRLADDATG